LEAGISGNIVRSTGIGTTWESISGTTWESISGTTEHLRGVVF